MPKLINITNKLAIAFLFILPMSATFSTRTLASSYNTFSEYVSVFFCIFLIYILLFNQKKKQLFQVSYTAFLLMIFVFFLALQYAIKQPSYLAPYINPISVLALSIIAILLIDNSTISRQKFYTITAIVVIISCYLQIVESTFQLLHLDYKVSHIQFFGFDKLFYQDWNIFSMPDYNRIVGGIGQSNNLADILGWGIIANIYLFHNSNKSHSKIFYFFTTFIISLFIGFSQSRTAILYPIVLFIYGLFLRKKPNSKKLARHLLISCFIMLALFFISASILNLLNQLSSLVHEPLNITNAARNESVKSGSVTQRYYIWVKGLLMFIHHPIIGVGWHNFYGNFITTPLPFNIPWQMLEFGNIPNSHNIIIEFLATTGIIGTSLFCIFITYKFWHLYKLEASQQILPIGIGLIVLTHSLFEYPLFIGNIFIPFILIFGTYDQIFLQIKNSKQLKISLLSLTIISSIILANNINSLLILSQMKKPKNYSINNMNYNIMNVYSQSYRNVYFDDVADYMLLNNIIMVDRTPQNNKMFDTYYMILNRALTTNPNPVYLMNHIIMDVVYGKTDEAKVSINKFLLSYPTYKDSLKEIAKLHTGNNTKVYQQITTMIDSNK